MTPGAMKVAWVLQKSSDWLYLAARMEKKNKSSYQTCYTMLFYLLFSVCSRIPTINPVLKNTYKPCSAGKGFSPGQLVNHSPPKIIFFL